MSCYTYKGFELSYLIDFNKPLNCFEAKGTIMLNKSSKPYILDFATQSHQSAYAVEEIKKLMEHHVDFEWEQEALLSNNRVKIKP